MYEWYKSRINQLDALAPMLDLAVCSMIDARAPTVDIGKILMFAAPLLRTSAVDIDKSREVMHTSSRYLFTKCIPDYEESKN